MANIDAISDSRKHGIKENNVNWKDYEIYITRHFQRMFPSASIRHDVKRLGIVSKIER